jgi:hypothetical protein
MRISSAFALLLLAACTPGSGAAPEEPQERIACAIGGALELTEDCELERVTVEGGQVSTDGQKLLAADGAEVTQSALKGDRWEVILGEHRYVIPVRADAPRE